jgi:hypothetical protein
MIFQRWLTGVADALHIRSRADALRVYQVVGIPNRDTAYEKAKAVGAQFVFFVGLDGAVADCDVLDPDTRIPAVLLAFEGLAPTDVQLDGVASLNRPEFSAAALGAGVAVFDTQHQRFASWSTAADDFEASGNSAGGEQGVDMMQFKSRQEILDSNLNYYDKAHTLERFDAEEAGRPKPPPPPLSDIEKKNLAAIGSALKALGEESRTTAAKAADYEKRLPELRRSIDERLMSVNLDDDKTVLAIAADQIRAEAMGRFVHNLAGLGVLKAGIDSRLETQIAAFKHLLSQRGQFSDLTPPRWSAAGHMPPSHRVEAVLAAIEAMLK